MIPKSTSYPCSSPHGCTPVSAYRRPAVVNKKTWWKAVKIIDMIVVDGARRWLVVWDGEDDEGNGWDASYEPTRNVSTDLIEDYVNDGKERRSRTITIDTRPLDTIVQRKIAMQAMKETNTSFGQSHEFELEALSLRDVAEHYINAVASKYNLQVKRQYVTANKSTLVEIRLATPEMVGDFCSFEQFAPAGTASKSLRFSLGRQQCVDISIVGAIWLRFYDDCKMTPGCVQFMLEYQTAWINVSDGNIVGPHLGQESESPLKDDYYINELITYARVNLHDSHQLIQNGWRTMQPHEHFLPNHMVIGFH